MKPNVFRNFIEQYYRKWLSVTINIPITNNIGIDLLDSDTGIEMKCRLNKYSTNYAVHAYQVQEFEENNPQQELFWAFLTYNLTKPVSKIRTNENLSRLVRDTEVRIIHWDWIKQFPTSYPKTGPFIYAHSKDFPSEDKFTQYEKNGGRVYLPKGSILEDKITTPRKTESDAPF